jgi:hypothetical protein
MPTDEPQRERIERMLAALDELPPDEREAALSGLPEDDREAIRTAELEERELALPDEEEAPGPGE